MDIMFKKGRSSTNLKQEASPKEKKHSKSKSRDDGIPEEEPENVNNTSITSDNGQDESRTQISTNNLPSSSSNNSIPPTYESPKLVKSHSSVIVSSPTLISGPTLITTPSSPISPRANQDAPSTPTSPTTQGLVTSPSSDSVGSSKFRKIPSDPKSPSLFRVGSKSKTPMLEKEFSISSMPSIDPSTLSGAKLDMVFKIVLNEMGVPDVARQSMMTMSDQKKKTLIDQFKLNPVPQRSLTHPGNTMPEGEELNRVFTQLLNELGIPEERQTTMMSLSKEKKWLLITQHKDRHLKQENKPMEKDTSSPKFYITLLESKVISQEEIVHLRVCVTSSPLQWIKEFINLGGITLLNSNIEGKIKKETKSGTDIYMIQEILAIFKALMNTDEGLANMVNRVDVVSTIVQLLTSSDSKIKDMIVEIFAVLCMVSSQGYRQIICAFKMFKEIEKEEKRFTTLVKSLLWQNNSTDYLVTAMTLINCLVNVPEDIAFRIRIRREFINLGILSIIKTLRSHDDEDLLLQLDVFEDHMESDALEAKELGIDVTSIDEEDPAKIFAFLHKSTLDTPFYLPFLQTLQHILDFTTDITAGPKIWESYKSMSVQLMKLRDSLELQDEEEVTVAPKNTSQFAKMKTEYTRQIDALEKMLQATVGQVEQMKREREEKNKIIASLMTQIKSLSPSEGNKVPSPNLSAAPQKKTIRSTFFGKDKDKKKQDEKDKLDSIASMYVTEETQKLKATVDNLEATNSDLLVKIAALSHEIGVMKGDEKYANLASPRFGQPTSESGTPSTTPSSATSSDTPADASATPSGEGAPVTGGPPPPPPPPGSAPPPPPPPPGGGPPPPPPPPGGKGGAPPLPGKKAPAKPVITPNIKMKQVNWAKMNYNQTVGSVWEKADDAKILANLDIATVEGLFGANVVEKKEALPGAKKTTVVTLVDPKKANNCAIMLTKFKSVSFAELRKAILTVNEDVIDEEGAHALAQFAPTKEEVELIAAYDGDPTVLGKAEQFYREIMSVPKLQVRLRCIANKMSFYKTLNDIKPDVQAVTKGSEELQRSKKLLKVLELILALGNYLNGGSARGGAFGFKIDSLLKLKDTRSNDPTVGTMLHYIVNMVESVDKDLSNFAEELRHVEIAAKVNTGILLSSIATLRKNLDEIEKEAAAAPDKLDDCFKLVMTQFLAAAKPEFKEVEENAKRMEEVSKSLGKLFGEPSAKPEEVFAIFAAFIDSYAKARDENVRKKEAAAKAAARKKQQEAVAATKRAIAEAAKKEKENAPSITITGGAGGPEESKENVEREKSERGGMDNMLAALRSGNAFRRYSANVTGVNFNPSSLSPGLGKVVE